MMGIDILERGQIKTRRTEDLGLLRKIREGGYQKEDGTFQKEFYDILEAYEIRLEQAVKNSVLPEHPDMEQVEAFVESVNRRAIERDFQ